MERLQIWDYDKIAKGPEMQGTVQRVPDSELRPGETDTEWRLRMLLKHLQTLAADADTLLRAYPSRAHAVDEVVKDFSHYLGLAKKAADEGLISEEMIEKACAVEAHITEMSQKNNPKLWSDEALHKKYEWRAVRRLATEALEVMGYDLEPPPPGSM